MRRGGHTDTTSKPWPSLEPAGHTEPSWGGLQVELG